VSAGWLACDNPEPHPRHEWLYVDPNTRQAVVATCFGDPADLGEPE